MISVKRSGLSIKNGWSTVLRSYYGVCSSVENKPAKDLSDELLAGSSSMTIDRTAINDFAKQMNMVWTLCPFERSVGEVYHVAKSIPRTSGILVLLTGYKRTYRRVSSHPACHPACHLTAINGVDTMFPSFTRSFASKASNANRENKSESGKEVSTVDSPFTDITDEIPQTPVTFKEGASYSVVILAGLGIAAAAAYAVFKELIFQPKEYKIFNKALERIQNDSQVRVRIGSPITGYGQESRNRAARQRIPNRIWTDEDGIEHVEVNFYIRGPHGGGKVYSEMFKDKEDKQWKFTYLIIDIKAPSPAQLMLESYVPA